MEFPVSIKGVIVKKDQVLLVKNHRDEWELPGGRIEIGESPEHCLQREIREELKLDVKILSIIDTKLFEVIQGRHVFLVAFFCEMINNNDIIEISHEHTEFQWFTIKELVQIKIPKEYIATIEKSTKEWRKNMECP